MSTQETLHTEQGLRQGRLTLADVIAQSVAVIAPALSGGIISYLAATKAGGATPLAYLLAMVGTLCIGGVVSEFGRHLPSAGSIYTYTTSGLSRMSGFVVGWSYSLTFMILGGAVLAGFGYFASILVQSLAAERSGATAIAWYWFFLAGLVALALMSLFDVRVSTRAQLMFTVASVAIMVVAAVVVIGHGSPEESANGGAHLDLGAFWPGAAGVPWSGVAFGLSFGILSFTGFETGAVLAEETSDPKRNIPWAVIGSVVAAGLFYLLVTYATAIGFGIREAADAWPGAAAGLVAVTPYSWLGKLVLFAIATSCLFCALGLHTVVSRTVYAMGREHVLPSILGSTHWRWRTPSTAILINLVLMAVAVFGCVTLLSPGTEVAVAAVAAEAVDQNPAASPPSPTWPPSGPLRSCSPTSSWAWPVSARGGAPASVASPGSERQRPSRVWSPSSGASTTPSLTEPSSSLGSFPSWPSSSSVQDWRWERCCAPHAGTPGRRWDVSSRSDPGREDSKARRLDSRVFGSY